MHTALQSVHQCGGHQGPASTAFIHLLHLLPTLGVQSAAAGATEYLVLDLVKRVAKAERLLDSHRAEVQAALHALFVEDAAIGKHLQE